MSNIEWKDQQQLDEHYNKHVLGKGLEKNNKNEPQIWINNNYSKKVSKEEYENKSKENINGNHYLCKDKSSKTISINYYNSNNEVDYLLTCTKMKDSDFKIYSCYFTNIEQIHPFMSIYYFANNLKKVSNGEYVSEDFTKYELNDKFDEDYLDIIDSNLDNPLYSDEEEITLFQMEFLKRFLEENLYCQKNNRKIWINQLLYNKLNSIVKGEEYKLKGEENNELKTIYNDIKQYAEDKNTYLENKDAIDLLIEINNLINDKHIIKFPPGETSRWTMFNNFKKWKNGEYIE